MVLAPRVARWLLLPALWGLAVARPAQALEPDSSAVSQVAKTARPRRPSSWQLGAGGAGSLQGGGWSAVATYERVLDPWKSAVARGEYLRVRDRDAFRIDYSIPAWSVSESVTVGSDAWVDSYAIVVGARATRSATTTHVYVESTLGPAFERTRGRNHPSALVGIAGGAMVQPVRSPVGAFAELRTGLVFTDSGLFVTGRAGLLLQRP